MAAVSLKRSIVNLGTVNNAYFTIKAQIGHSYSQSDSRGVSIIITFLSGLSSYSSEPDYCKKKVKSLLRTVLPSGLYNIELKLV